MSEQMIRQSMENMGYDAEAIEEAVRAFGEDEKQHPAQDEAMQAAADA